MQKFDYDTKYDDLFIYNSDKKSRGAVEFGDLIIDFDSNMNVVAIEMTNASDYLSKLVDLFNKETLRKLKDCRFNAVRHKNMLIIKLLLVSENDKINIPIQVPCVMDKSPAA